VSSQLPIDTILRRRCSQAGSVHTTCGRPVSPATMPGQFLGQQQRGHGQGRTWNYIEGAFRARRSRLISKENPTTAHNPHAPTVATVELTRSTIYRAASCFRSARSAARTIQVRQQGRSPSQGRRGAGSGRRGVIRTTRWIGRGPRGGRRGR